MRLSKRLFPIVFLAALVTACGGGGGSVLPSNGAVQVGQPGAGSTSTPSPAPSATPSPDPTKGPHHHPSPTPSPTPDPHHTPTPDPHYTPTPDPHYTPTPDPHYTPTPHPTSSPTPEPTQSPSGNVVWRAGDPQNGQWIRANTYQCGNPVQNGSSFTFNLTMNGQSCGRNQLLPVDGSGQPSQLQEGQSYTFTFHYVDGTPTGSGPGMGLDNGVADSLIWQVHPWNCGSGTLGVRLNFIDNTNDIGYGNQHWGFYAPQSDGSTLWWVGSYTSGEQDNFEIQLAPASYTSSGVTKFYRNGVLQFTKTGANYVNCDGHAPWWNFGPYKWRWELPGGGGSAMTEVNATIDNMTETSP